MSIIETMIDIPMEHERNVCGQFDAYLKKIERTLHVTMITRDGALKIIEENSKARTQYATLPSSCGAMHGLILAPIEVKVGGATVFVLDVEQFHKY